MNKAQLIKEYALNLGFDDVGIIKADFLKDEEKRLREWLNRRYNAEMSYMERNFQKRLDVRELVENAKTVIVVLKNYYPKELQQADTYQISKYAYSADYHKIIKDDLHKLFNYINSEIQPILGRVFVDSAPVLEKTLAKNAGLGWIGKNSLLLTKKGSYYFIGEIIIDLELNYDDVDFLSYCGTCTKCIDACPTNAIVEPYIVDANKCISYLSIEKKGAFDEKMSLNFENNIFGCDICQDVCPWNRKVKSTIDERFNPNFLLLQLKKDDWINLSKQKFDNIFNTSAVKRTKYEGLMRNIEYVNKNNDNETTMTKLPIDS